MAVFWELSRNSDRIKAEADLRMLRLLSNVVGGDPQRVANELMKERGEITEASDPYSGFDRSGLNKLRALMGGGR